MTPLEAAEERVLTETLVRYLRSTPHRLADVRAGLADVLDGGSPDALERAVAAVYADGVESWTYLEAQSRAWAASGNPVLARCASELESARASRWDSALDELA